jgi:hypothetical protein
VHDHPPDFHAYASRLSSEVAASLSAALATQLRGCAGGAAAAARLPTVVRAVVAEGCVQLVAWAAGALAHLAMGPPVPLAGGDTAPAAADSGPQRLERGVVEEVVSGSELLRAAASATLQVGGTVATLRGGGGAAFSQLSGRCAGSGACDSADRGDLQLQYAWPCCLPVAAAPCCAAAAGAVLEVRLAPAAAGVRALRARALLVDGADVLLDARLVLDTARPVVRWGRMTGPHG